jgi:hypothetical protein
MRVDAPEKPSLDDRIRRRIGMLLRQEYDDQLYEELPPKLARRLDRLRLTPAAPDSNELYLIDGLYLGQLSEFEFEVFERAVAEGKAVREYAGFSGFLGLATVKVIRSAHSGDHDRGFRRIATTHSD